MPKSELQYESQNQNVNQLGDNVEKDKAEKLNISEHERESKHHYSTLQNGILHQQQQTLLATPDRNFVISQHTGAGGEASIYTHWPRSLEQQTEESYSADAFASNASSQQNFANSQNFQYTSAPYANQNSLFDFSKLVTVSSAHGTGDGMHLSDPQDHHLTDSQDEEEDEEEEEDDEPHFENLEQKISTPPPQSKSFPMKTSRENEDEDSFDEEEDDVHQCGRCKEVFQKLQDYISHKTSKICKTSKNTPQKIAKSESSPHDETAGQNILAAAAKNTIFRDSFVELEPTQQQMMGKKLKQLETRGDENQATKKRRGRPPGAKTNFVHHFMPAKDRMDSGEEGDDSLPTKAKRKSRPPRRHNPDFGTSTASSEPALLSAIDQSSGLPTVENIHKFFANGRGRSRGKMRHALHRCAICQLLFPSRITMIEHRRKHTKEHKCKICNEGFYTEDKLERHMTKETHSYPCDQCERIFTGKTALLRHKLSHSDKIHKCALCSKSFKSPRDLKNHTVGMHSLTQDFVCEVCGKAFSRREKLKRHLMIHAPDRPIYPCPFKNHVGCQKTFYRKDKLTRHLYSHSKVKPFKCEQCDKSFARTDNLREHIRSHTGIFRYYCTVCGKGQPGPKKFVQHMLKHHNVENPEIPKPFEELAPEPLIQQHKAVVEAEAAARLARAASNLKKEREKGEQQKFRKEEIETQECLDQHHVTLANIGNLSLVNSAAAAYLNTPPDQDGTSTEAQNRAALETLYTINPQVPESVVRQINDNFIRESIARANLAAARGQQPTGAETVTVRQLTSAEDSEEAVQLQETLNRQLTAAAADANTQQQLTENLRRQISEAQQQQQQQIVEQQQQQDGGVVPVTRGGMQLISTAQLPANLQFTTLLNSDLVAIGEAVIRNQNGIPIFQQRFDAAQ